MSEHTRRMVLLAIFWAPSLVIAVMVYFDVFSPAFRRKGTGEHAKRITAGNQNNSEGN